MEKRVYKFSEGQAAWKELLGGKGAGLAEMTRAGLPVPPGFTVTTEACRQYYRHGRRLPDSLFAEIESQLAWLEEERGQRFGDPARPLLVSVRSGSVTSMPGMMDTILNLGLNDETVEGLARLTGNPRFAYDCYRRLLQMYGSVVLGIAAIRFEHPLEQLKEERGLPSDQDLSAEDWKRLIGIFQAVIAEESGEAFPQDVRIQLRRAVEAVFRSWSNNRAAVYRKLHRIPEEQGTAVNVQAMVFGNMGGQSGTGVLFTRNPSDGEKRLFGEYLMNAQGEDVVAGTRTPSEIARLAVELPDAYARLEETAALLERHYRDMQDIEFTIEQGELFILQTRSGKRTAQAAVRIAVDLVQEGIIAKEDALRQIDVTHLNQLLHRGIDESEIVRVFAAGLPASPGAASGQLVFDADMAEEWGKAGRKVVLVRTETTPEDIHGVIAAEGTLTSRGGMTSHAAVVARGMGKPCVCGCEELLVDTEARTLTARGETLAEGDWISIDGSTGRVVAGTLKLREAVISDELRTLLGWADEVKRLRVLTNADTPQDARKARELGAEGIGLCRTEHMFFSPARLPVMQSLILADNEEERRHALRRLLPMQQADFEELFRVMDGLPVTIRLLDPPLHEFMPKLEELLKRREALARAGASDSEEARLVERLIHKVKLLHETNPMLGQRGCRLGIVFPEIYDMQAEAIFRAVLRCLHESIEVHPEIMVPLVGHANELKKLREWIDSAAEQVLGEERRSCAYRVGTMIEVPRAALTAAQIARYADFFSFGTNDLTQMTYGFSRDDAEGKFLTHYLDAKVLEDNPFQVLDPDGVGQLIEMAVRQGRQVKPKLRTGVCGEHGGDKESILFCHDAGLDYVSCSPYRVPLARIAAAQAALRERADCPVPEAIPTG
ncbi:pyruvate, phosphate dikinase [Paenibacillus sp. J31TS4]|uniref:pyruvate, phosphate dikinase n=1 Tax=Paenibacillus sp. J31TS4 TaxID=2807195 RepID=UPI001B151F89|nr:pyruvate, phosphate dikinase [Paenibacillus sp. J31TS4]GIP39000.1 pyruvate, phosphate dikinase [Paenibacillus sp. J31TS4]